MSKFNTSFFKDYFGRKAHLFFALIAAIPVMMASSSFANRATIIQNQLVAIIAGLIFLASIFTGRYLGGVYMSRRTNVRNRTYIVLALTITACLCWLFFYTEFPLTDRRSMSLLLFYFPLFIMSVCIGVLIKVVRTVAQQQLVEAKTSAEQSLGELSLLQSQLSPHFLFNTLNNLYGLSLGEPQKLPPLLLKLSDLLRYSVYQAGEAFVPLKDEIDYIRNYIDFEKIRIGDKLVINVQMDPIDARTVRIAPMLLIVFVENAFKHSKNTASERIYIDLSLRTWEDFILFTIKNSHSKTKESENKVSTNSGYGLENVRKRLELLYRNNYILELKDEDQTYKVMLQLKMK